MASSGERISDELTSEYYAVHEASLISIAGSARRFLGSPRDYDFALGLVICRTQLGSKPTKVVSRLLHQISRIRRGKVIDDKARYLSRNVLVDPSGGTLDSDSENIEPRVSPVATQTKNQRTTKPMATAQVARIVA